MEKSCNTCAKHVQGTAFDDAPQACRECLRGWEFVDGNPVSTLPNWTPIDTHGRLRAALAKGDGTGTDSTEATTFGPLSAPLPAPSDERKGMPVFSGALMYFPDALLALSKHSKAGNDKYNPGEPLHWAKHKSQEHADCIARHLLDIGPEWDALDPETGSLHAVALFWRAGALLQTVIEAKKAGLSVREYQAKLRADATK